MQKGQPVRAGLVRVIDGGGVEAAPHFPTSIHALAVHGAAGVKAIS